MASITSVEIGIVAVRRHLTNSWQSQEWSPAQAFLFNFQTVPGLMFRQSDEVEFHFVGASNLVLHKTETASYRLNIRQNKPRIYVVLKPAERQEAAPTVHLVTVAPDEAEAYLEGDEWIVGGVPMPEALRDLVGAYIHEHHFDSPPQGLRTGNRSASIGPKPGGTS